MFKITTHLVQATKTMNLPGAMSMTSPLFGSLQPQRAKASVTQKYVRPGVTPCLEPHEFFNRSQECRDVENILNNKPQLSLFLGPSNSGKTTLLRHVLSQMVQDRNRPILHLDLRTVNFNTQDRSFCQKAGGSRV